MKIIRNKYWIYLITATLCAGTLIHNTHSSDFTVIRNSAVLAPTSKPVYNIDIEQGNGVNADGKININTASVSELSQLDGIGAGLSKRIIEFRAENGRFEVIQDIMKVSGIGEKTFAQIKDYIAIE